MPDATLDGPNLILSRNLLDNFVFNDQHLSSNNEEAVLKCLTLLIKDITLGKPIYTSSIMSIIRYVLPMKSKSVQRALHVFFELLPKRDPANGEFIASLIMICEIISQHIRGPNEYLAGCTLRFLSNLREPNLINPLLPSIMGAITHENLYVRANALHCMLQLSVRNPTLFDSDLEKKAYDVLDNDESVECQVMAFKIIANHDPEKAFSFITSIAAHTQNLHPQFKYTLIRFLDDQFKAQKNGQGMLKLINNEHLLLFMCDVLEDDANEVVLEAATVIMNYDYDQKLVIRAFEAVIGVMLQESQSGVKISLLEYLCCYKSSKLFFQVLMDNATKIVENFLMSDSDCKCAALKAVEDLIDSSNVRTICLLIFRFLQKQDVIKITDADLAQTSTLGTHVTSVVLALQTLDICCKSFPFHTAQAVYENVPRISALYAHEYFTNMITVILDHLLEIDSLCIEGLKKLIEISHSSTSMPLSPLFWLLTKNISSLEAANVFYDQVLADDSIVSDFMSQIDELLPLFVCLAKVMVILEENQQKQKVLVILRIMGKVYSCANVPSDSETPAKTTLSSSSSVLMMNMFWSAVKKRDVEFMKKLIVQTYEKSSLDKPSGELRLNVDPRKVTDPLDLNIFSESLIKPNSNSVFNNSQSVEISDAANLNQVVQLTSINDDVYAEAFLLGGKYEVVIDMMLVNRLSKTMYNLKFGAVLSEGMTTDPFPKVNDIRPGHVETLKLRIRLSSPTSSFAALSLTYHVGSSASEQQILHMNNIQIASMDQIIPKSCDRLFFRSKWPLLGWEKAMSSMVVRIPSKDSFIKRLNTEAGLSLIKDSFHSSDWSSREISMLNFCATTVLGELILVNLCVQPVNAGQKHSSNSDSENASQCSFKIRSSDKETASKMSKVILKSLKVFV